MDSADLHGDALLVRHLLARLTPAERESVLSLQPEVQELQAARDALRRRIAALAAPTGWEAWS
jgi:hypothetical protein